MPHRMLTAAGWLGLVLCVAPLADVVLEADDASGHDACWEPRYELGKQCWGIQGNHVVTSGTMWFNSFPGATGEYDVSLGIIAEADGRPAYRVTTGSRVLDEGVYPWGDGERCASELKNIDRIDLGRHTVNSGERVELWGESTYECSIDHGAYARWFEMRFVPVGGSTAPPTAILSPAEGAELTEGVSYTFSGEGENLSWSYDASSDGLGSVDMGTGATVDYVVPTGVTSAKLMHVTLTGSSGTVTRTYQIVAPSSQPMVTVLAPNGGETVAVGEELHIRWEADATNVSDVVISVSLDDGENWVVLNPNNSIARTNPLWGDYAWVVPAAVTVGTGQVPVASASCKVRVAKYEAPESQYLDESDAVFTIESSGSVLARSPRIRLVSEGRYGSAWYRLNGSRSAGPAAGVAIRAARNGTARPVVAAGNRALHTPSR